ncbi:hypothetical protein BLTE_13650 [Blastochloris tepida]|jgi:hypothetical protein|uniref:Uncharacterized protein n=1 Tax=Blastochloris tepida TaxID=2233851 RepID=A0A348FZE7_9HYPH|nr:hypothetical protein [Blastochloris tepida]BBF92680.1 hypothetical protein BLTE_13650 [Blastochloris tepida]
MPPDLTPLYISDKEAGLLLLGRKRASEWPAIATVLERSGLPKVDPLMGGRYWPAVKAWLDRRHGVGSTGGGYAADGQENWSYGRKAKSV